MVIQKSDVREGGDILVGHGLIITPALLLDKKLSLDEGRLLDFCTLINALTLHDRVIALRASIPDNLGESSLYRYLRERKILEEVEFNSDDFPSESKNEMLYDLLDSTFSEDDLNKVTSGIYDRYSYYRYNETYSEESNDLEKSVSTPSVARSIRVRFINEVINHKPDGWNKSDIIAALRPMSRDPTGTPGSMSQDPLDYLFLRTAAYWEIAGILKLAFVPDFMRIPIISGYNQSIKQSLRMFLTSEIDESTKRELKDAMRIAGSMIIPIPNAVSNFLHRYSTTSSIEEALDSMREEFAEDRKTIVDWEKKMLRADTRSFSETIEIMKEIRSSLESLQRSDRSKLVVSASSAVSSDLLGGTPGLATSELLIKQGYNLIRRWRQRARISYLNTGRTEAANLDNRGDLLREAFVGTLTPRQAERFSRLSQYLEDLTRNYDTPH